jgi:LPXTG-motif cell wall-anchored protein
MRHQAGVVAGVLLTCGISVFAPASARAQGAFAMPEKGSMITVTGCFGFTEHQQYVLASPTMDQVRSVPNASCNASGPMIKLQDVKKNGLDKSMLGRTLEVSGRVGANHSNPDRIRKLHMKSYRFIPIEEVVAEAIIVPPPIERTAPVAPAPYVAPLPQQPVGTTGTLRRELPKTASSLPLVGLIGLVSLAGGLTLHLFGRRRLGQG